jgi:hypothetical protein
VKRFLAPLLNLHFDAEFLHVENYIAFDNPQIIEDAAEFISSSDLIIYQPLSEYHRGVPAAGGLHERVLELSPVRAARVSVPYIFNDALWPICSEADKIVTSGLAVHAIRSEPSLSAAIALYDSGKLDFSFLERFLEAMANVAAREKRSDVKISEFLMKNIHKRRLFFTQNHPTSCVFVECARQIYSRCGELFEFTPAGGHIIAEFDKVEENDVQLPGYWPIDQYSLGFYRFRWCRHPDDGAVHYYRSLISKIWHSRQTG